VCPKIWVHTHTHTHTHISNCISYSTCLEGRQWSGEGNSKSQKKHTWSRWRRGWPHSAGAPRLVSLYYFYKEVCNMNVLYIALECYLICSIVILCNMC